MFVLSADSPPLGSHRKVLPPSTTFLLVFLLSPSLSSCFLYCASVCVCAALSLTPHNKDVCKQQTKRDAGLSADEALGYFDTVDPIRIQTQTGTQALTHPLLSLGNFFSVS